MKQISITNSLYRDIKYEILIIFYRDKKALCIKGVSYEHNVIQNYGNFLKILYNIKNIEFLWIIIYIRRK